MSTTPRTWVVGEVVTAAEMNTEIRDQFNDLFAAWLTTWTPTLGASTTNPTLLTTTGRYKLIGKTVLGMWDIAWTASSTNGSGIYQGFNLPVTGRRVVDGPEMMIGTFQLNGTNLYNGVLIVSSGSGNYTSATRFRISDNSANVGTANWASTVPAAMASGNGIRGQFMYEAA